MTRDIQADALANIVQTLQKLEQSAVKLADKATYSKDPKELQQAVFAHEKTVVLKVIELVNVIEKLQEVTR